MRFKNDDYIDVYMDCSHPLYFEGVLKEEGDYKLEPLSDDGEKIYTPISYATLIKLNRSNLIKKQMVRISEDMEEEVLKSLKIDLSKERESYTSEEIEQMILYPTDDILKEIVKIKDKKVVERFLATLIGLKSTNQYDISVKLEEYIRGRLEEIEDNELETALEVTETLNKKNIEMAVVPNDASKETEIKEKVEEKQTTSKSRKSKTKK